MTGRSQEPPLTSLADFLLGHDQQIFKHGVYTLWLYYPSLTGQTLYSAVNDFIEPKLKQVSRDVAALRDKGSARSRDDEKSFEALQALELELIELRDTLLQIAQTYRPNHDDGVQVARHHIVECMKAPNAKLGVVIFYHFHKCIRVGK